MSYSLKSIQKYYLRDLRVLFPITGEFSDTGDYIEEFGYLLIGYFYKTKIRDIIYLIYHLYHSSLNLILKFNSYFFNGFLN